MFVPRVLPYGRVRAIQLGASMLAFTLLLCMFKAYHAPRHHVATIYDYTDGRTNLQGDGNATSSSEEGAYLRYLQETYGLTKDIPWFGRRIQSGFRSGRRLSMTEAAANFMDRDFAVAHVDDDRLMLAAEKSIKLSFHRSAQPHEIDASGLLFGISTKYSRLSYSNYSLVQDWERWLTDGRGHSNGASLLLDLHRASKEEQTRIARVLRERGIDATVRASTSSMDTASRYADLITELRSYNEDIVRRGENSKKFFALADDDVFFASMAKLLGKLSNFSPRKEFYIGAPSEKQSDWVVDENVTMTYGGGAVFITSPMADRLAELPCLHGSGDSDSQWDEHLYNCVAKSTKADFHVLPSFYSPNEEALYGDEGAGSWGYGGGIQPLTLHHYRNWHRFDAGKGHQVTSICGEECFLQRFHFRDDWILVNGYTISQYPDGVSTIPLRKNTKLVSQFRDKNRMVVGENLVVDNTERPADTKVIAWRGPKRTWRLLDSRATASGEVWQAYVKRRGAGNSYGEIDDWLPGDKVHTDEEPSNEDSVIVLIWQP